MTAQAVPRVLLSPRSRILAPVMLTIAGAIAGSLCAVISGFAREEFRELVFCALLGGGIGQGMGFALAASRHWWIRLLLAPPVACLCFATGAFLKELGMRPDSATGFGEYVSSAFCGYLAAPAAGILVLTHHAWLHLRSRLHGALIALGYAVAGALSGLPFWLWFIIGWQDRPHLVLALGLLDGAVYGLFQHVGFVVALRFGARCPERVPDHSITGG